MGCRVQEFLGLAMFQLWSIYIVLATSPHIHGMRHGRLPFHLWHHTFFASRKIKIIVLGSKSGKYKRFKLLNDDSWCVILFILYYGINIVTNNKVFLTDSLMIQKFVKFRKFYKYVIFKIDSHI